MVTKVEPKEMEMLNEDELVILIKNFKNLDHEEQSLWRQILCDNFVFCSAHFLLINFEFSYSLKAL